MKKYVLLTFLALLSLLAFRQLNNFSIDRGAPPYVVEDLEPPSDTDENWLTNWTRPEGPPKVGLQVGHWQNNQVPTELERLKGNTGATGGGKAEWEVNLEIAQQTKLLLENRGIQVDILPTTVPPRYWADVFVAIHADGNPDTQTNGYKVAAPRADFSTHGQELANFIDVAYENTTDLAKDPNISRNMTGYYAFAWWRYEHSVHPMTASAILETGFLTSSHDRKIIVNQPQVSAQGLAAGILAYLESQNLLETS